MDYKYQAIILGKYDIGEVDRIYTLYTKEAGKIRIRAMGVKKPNAKLAGNLETLTQAEIFLARGRGRGNITGAIATNNFLGIKSEIAALQKVFYVFRIFNRLITEEEKDESIFLLLQNYLEALDILTTAEKKINMDIVTLGFLVKLLEETGYKIEADRCVKCRDMLNNQKIFFSPERGGIVCEQCGIHIIKKIKITPGAVKMLRIFSTNKIANFNKLRAEKETINNLKAVIDEEIKWIIN
jgi:DNA repair protein RecO (recombination protein O)